VSAEGDNSAARVAAPECIKSSTTRSRVVDHDGSERLAESSLDGQLPAFINLDQIQQCSQYTVNALETLSARPGARCVKRHLESLNSCRPS
jgi:hypothetical protein